MSFAHWLGPLPATAVSMGRCDGDPMLVLGEVHTGLLQNSTSLASSECEQLLGFMASEAVRRSERPIPYAASPDLLTGVDCSLATASGAKVRGVGTVLHRATITAGRVVQGSSLTQVIRGTAGRRLPWSHYLARPGRVETIGKADWTDLTGGFVVTTSLASTLDLGAISGRMVDTVQSSPGLDRSAPFLAPRTKLRWTATTVAEPGDGTGDGTGDGSAIAFGIENSQLRTLRLQCAEEQLPAVAELCEDLAVHDWLLTTLLQLIERSRIGTGAPAAVVVRLRPVIDHLLHLWMPAARVRQDLLTLWESLERRPGFSRQWQASVDRIRDQIAVGTIALLGARAGGAPDE
jgi:hypothetical protein